MFYENLDFLLFNYSLLAVFAISVLVKSSLEKKALPKGSVDENVSGSELSDKKSSSAQRLTTQMLIYLCMYSVFSFDRQIVLYFVLVISAAAIYELLNNLQGGLLPVQKHRRMGIKFSFFQLGFACALLFYAPFKIYFPDFQALPIIIYLTLSSVLAISCIQKSLSKQLFLFALVAVVIYVFSMLLDLSQLENGMALCLYVFFLVNWSDSSALFFGRLFGTKKIFPQLSPKKTLEGVLGAFLTCVILAFLFNTLLGLSLEFYKVVTLGIMIPLLSQTGDLLFSAFKREAGIKDYGNVLPGHGGILDRFDSLILSLPFVYFMLKI